MNTSVRFCLSCGLTALKVYFHENLRCCNERCHDVNCSAEGSIPLNIHEMWPRPFWGEAYRRKKISVDHFIGHKSLLYKKLIEDQLY